ncbi:MAG: acetyl-CoA C-acetyltransferase [Halieaceae bacterium]|nr:acetyl-CoA C-acetyltransferase [Halieaceae bacterium]
MSEAYIIDAVRTPRGAGKPGKGGLVNCHPQHLAATVMRAIADRNELEQNTIDDVIWGTSSQKGKQGGDVGRMAALDAGLGIEVSGVTMDRFCGSGLTAIGLAAGQLKAGFDDLLIAGGSEMMSEIESQRRLEQEHKIPSVGLGTGNLRLQAKFPQSHQGVCADAVASIEGIDRSALDSIAIESQKRADIALREGRFKQSIVSVLGDDGAVILAHDEHPRPGTTLEDLAKLAPSFAQISEMVIDRQGTTFKGLINKVYPDVDIQHFHHAGNSSGVVDGAAALLLASAHTVQKRGLKPRARILTTANVGSCPTLMLNSPVAAAQKALQKAGLTIADIDLWEVNEAFAVVVEKFIRDLDLNRDLVNVNGGAIAMGHPIGATGAVLVGTVLDELERRDLKRGLITMCAAGGMGPAIIIERV